MSIPDPLVKGTARAKPAFCQFSLGGTYWFLLQGKRLRIWAEGLSSEAKKPAEFLAVYRAEKTTVAVLSASAASNLGAKIWKKRKLQRDKPDNLSFPHKRYSEFLSFKDRMLKAEQKTSENRAKFSAVSGWGGSRSSEPHPGRGCK